MLSMLDRFVRSIKYKRTYIGKSHITTGNAYKINLAYNHHYCSFVFNDNFKNESKKKDFLYCLLLDAMAYDQARDVYDFARTFGYDMYTREEIAKVRKIYYACREQSKRLHRLFNEQEIELLSMIE